MKFKKTRITGQLTNEAAIVRFQFAHLRDASDVKKVEDEVMEVAEHYDIKLLVLDFSRLQHVTSSMLSKLVSINKELRALSIELRVCCLTPPVEQAFKICNLQKLVPVFPNEKKALGL